MTMLHITNGSGAAQLLQAAELKGKIITWDDVLHEGPVPPNLDFEALSQIRIAFITQKGWAAPTAVRSKFKLRDQALAAHEDHEEIVLWFEHDLYDQLQLLQVLDYFAQNPGSHDRLTAVLPNHHLGTMTPDEAFSAFQNRVRITRDQRDLAKKAWLAFRQPVPVSWAAMAKQTHQALPHLAAAVLRHLQTFPYCNLGLNRTQLTTLRLLEAGTCMTHQLFRAVTREEQAAFMGDLIYWDQLRTLCDGPRPLLLVEDGDLGESDQNQRLQLTDAARDVLAGKTGWDPFHAGPIHRGGVTCSPQNRWCYHPEQSTLIHV